MGKIFIFNIIIMEKKIRRLFVFLVLLLPFMEILGQVNIVPLPQKAITHNGYFYLKNNQKIGISNSSLKDAAAYLKGILSSTGYHFIIHKGRGTINLILTGSKKYSSDESYTLSVLNQRIDIKAKSYRGIIDGIASLRQLLPDEVESKTIVKGIKWSVPTVDIFDKPSYKWRGLMLDVSRHFYNKKQVEEFLDLMALYKFNKFHWHLTDDQGWRIEIKKYPLLTEKGAWRKMIDIDQMCIDRAKKEGNPNFEIPKDKFKVIKGDTLYGGYYTQQDIKDIVKYAAIRGIDVIPELDMPGHCFAAVSNYKGLTCFETTSAAPFCPGKDSTMRFCKNVYNEVFKLFPYKYVHLGADEVDETNWKKCSDCQKRIKDEGLKSEVQLHAWFVHQMEKYFNNNGKKMIGWDEILEGGLSPTATVDWWRGELGDVVNKTTAHGNEVVLCPTTYCYFDYQQDNNTIKRLYLGKIIPDSLSTKQCSLIKGMQANIWTEFIPSQERMQYMAYPRALALSERAWTNSVLQNWDSFSIRLQAQLKRLNVMNVNYRGLN